MAVGGPMAATLPPPGIHMHRLAAASRIAIAVASLLLSANASATDAIEAAESPLAAVDALFEAMATHDTHTARQLIVPGAQFVVVRPDGTSAMRDDAGFIGSLAQRPESVLRERMWNHQVLVDGPMAQVWGPYDFHVDGTFSHCGVNSIGLVRGADGWRVAAVSYTMRKDG